MTDGAPMHLMSYRGFVAEVARDPGLGGFVGTLRDVPDSVRFHAPTVAGLSGSMAEAVDDYIARRQEWGLPILRPFTGDRQIRFENVRQSA